MSDIYLNDVRAHLKIAQISLAARLKMIEDKPVGMIMRRNRATHTNAMISLLGELMDLAAHDPNMWWGNDESVPF